MVVYQSRSQPLSFLNHHCFVVKMTTVYFAGCPGADRFKVRPSNFIFLHRSNYARFPGHGADRVKVSLAFLFFFRRPIPFSTVDTNCNE